MKALKNILVTALLLTSGAVFASDYGILPSHSNDLHASDKAGHMHQQSHPGHAAGMHADDHAPVMPRHSTDR